MNDETEKPRLGVSGFLPPLAAATLVRAAEDARQYEQEELERVRIIDDAISEVREKWPQYFAEEGRASSRNRPAGVCCFKQEGFPDW